MQGTFATRRQLRGRQLSTTADELRELNVHEVCVQPPDDDEFTVHVDVAACRVQEIIFQAWNLRFAPRTACAPLRTAVVPDELEFWIGLSQADVRRERFYCLCSIYTQYSRL